MKLGTILLYKICKITKITVLWDKFLNIRIRKKKKKNKSKRRVMKKLVLVICALLCTNMLFAQENVKKEKDLAVVVDSLSAKLNELQKDYDYLCCRILLNEINSILNNNKNDIINCSNQLQFELYHGSFNYDLYNTNKEGYNVLMESVDVNKKYAEIVKNVVTVKMITSNYSEDELIVLQHGLNSLDGTINSVEASFRLYDWCIKEYRNKLNN